MEDEDVVDDDDEEEEEEEEEAHIDHRSGWHKMPLCCLPIYTRNSRNYLWYVCSMRLLALILQLRREREREREREHMGYTIE